LKLAGKQYPALKTDAIIKEEGSLGNITNQNANHYLLSKIFAKMK